MFMLRKYLKNDLIEALKGKGYGTDNKITIKELASYDRRCTTRSNL